MNTFLRYLQFLSLTIWVGGIIYLSFVVAPVLFTRLPNIDEAGAVVGVILPRLHWLGVICGGVYLASALALARSFRAFCRSGGRGGAAAGRGRGVGVAGGRHRPVRCQGGGATALDGGRGVHRGH